MVLRVIRWSFDGIDRWLNEVEEHAPGVPKVLVGNRLHLAFKRQVAAKQAELYAQRHKMVILHDNFSEVF
jgi:Ras-related protein Rab-40